MLHTTQPGSMSIQLLEREVEVLNRIHHPHLIQLIEVYETQKVNDLLHNTPSSTCDLLKIYYNNQFYN